MKNVTTKLLTLGITAALLTCGLTACKADKNININVSATIETKINSDPGNQMGAGSWETAESTEVNDELKSFFNDAVGKLDGYFFEPVALLGTQVVAGTNYCFLCKPTIKADNAMNSMVLTYINVDPSGSASYIKDERLVLPGTDAANGDDMMVGGWSYAVSSEITPELKDIMAKASETLTGAVYEPVAYVGSQVVAGTNHAMLCKVAPSTSGLSSPVTLAVVYIYEDLEGNCEITEVTDVVLNIG